MTTLCCFIILQSLFEIEDSVPLTILKSPWKTDGFAWHVS